MYVQLKEFTGYYLSLFSSVLRFRELHGYDFLADLKKKNRWIEHVVFHFLWSLNINFYSQSSLPCANISVLWCTPPIPHHGVVPFQKMRLVWADEVVNNGKTTIKSPTHPSNQSQAHWIFLQELIDSADQFIRIPDPGLLFDDDNSIQPSKRAKWWDWIMRTPRNKCRDGLDAMSGCSPIVLISYRSICWLITTSISLNPPSGWIWLIIIQGCSIKYRTIN